MQDHHIPFEERPIQTTELATADELWISSSTKTVVPATSLDGKPVGSGKPGPLWEQVASHFLSAIDKLEQ